MDFDLHEHTCVECKNIFYTELMPIEIRAITLPKFCPFCGVAFTYTFKTKEVMR